MDKASTCSCCSSTDDDRSVVICIHEKNIEEYVEQEKSEQEMEMTSCDIVLKHIDRSQETGIKETPSVSLTTSKQVEVVSDVIRNVAEVKEPATMIEEFQIQEKRPLNIPNHVLQSTLAKAIISSANGFLAIEDIEKYLIQNIPCCSKNVEGMKKLVLNTLENNTNVFMPHVIKKENNFESGFWTLHPLAAARFVCQGVAEMTPFTKKKHGSERISSRTCIPDKNELTVAVKRSLDLDYWASKRKVCKTDTVTMIVPSPETAKLLSDYGISFDMKWGGWESTDTELEDKICKLEAIIKKSEGSPSGIFENDQSNLEKATCSADDCKSPSSRGIKRCRSSDTCSDVDSSDNEAAGGKPVVHEEHNYVANKDSSGSRNLIENLRKIVQKMDRDCDKKTVNYKTKWDRRSPGCGSEAEEDFLGFDYDLSGYWRGWEKVSTKNAERMRKIAMKYEGSRDLEEVLKESDLAVTRCIEEIDRRELCRKEKINSPKPCDLETTVQEYIKIRNKLIQNSSNKTASINRMNTEVKMSLNENQRISQQGVIVDANSLESPNKTRREDDSHSNTLIMKLNGTNYSPIKLNTMEHLASTPETNRRQTTTKASLLENSFENSCRAVAASPVPVISSINSYCESAKGKQNSTPPRPVKNLGTATPEKIHLFRSPSKYPLKTEDQEIEIVDIDPLLHDKENLSSSSGEEEEIVLIDEEADLLQTSSAVSSVEKWTVEGVDRSSNCLFLLRCHDLDSERKQYPCYICHKFYGSNEILNIHFAQSHFEKENIHVTSVLCQNRRKKYKNKEISSHLNPSDNSLTDVPREDQGRIFHEFQSKRSDGVIRYSCSKCNAIFHEKETLNLHVSFFHEDTSLRSLHPLKQVSTPEGNRFYYCDQCSGCYHTEKALFVHKCVPFSREPTS